MDVVKLRQNTLEHFRRTLLVNGGPANLKNHNVVLVLDKCEETFNIYTRIEENDHSQKICHMCNSSILDIMDSMIISDKHVCSLNCAYAYIDTIITRNIPDPANLTKYCRLYIFIFGTGEILTAFGNNIISLKDSILEHDKKYYKLFNIDINDAHINHTLQNRTSGGQIINIYSVRELNCSVDLNDNMEYFVWGISKDKNDQNALFVTNAITASQLWEQKYNALEIKYSKLLDFANSVANIVLPVSTGVSDGSGGILDHILDELISSHKKLDEHNELKKGD